MWVRAFFLCVFLTVGVQSAAAQQDARAVRPQWVTPAQASGDARGNQNIRPLREVVEEMRSRYGGELISARLEEGGRPVYVLRWRMPDGQVRDFRVDAAR